MGTCSWLVRPADRGPATGVLFMLAPGRQPCRRHRAAGLLRERARSPAPAPTARSCTASPRRRRADAGGRHHHHAGRLREATSLPPRFPGTCRPTAGRSRRIVISLSLRATWSPRPWQLPRQTAARAPLLIRTDYLELDPDAYIARTERMVAVERSRDTLHARGMRVYLKQDRLQFQSEVRGRFLP